MRANWEKLKEGSNMCEALKELFADDFKESESKAGTPAELRERLKAEPRVQLLKL